jgi:hypothetical protein
MTRTLNTGVVVRVCYLEKEEVVGKGKEVRRWRELRWESIDAPHGLDIGNIEAIAADLRAARETLGSAQPDIDQPRKQLKAWSDDLDGLAGAESRLAEAQKAFELFHRPENLKRLPWLVRQDETQREVARWVLETVSGRKISDSDAHRALRAWHAEVRAEFGAVDVSVA